MHSLRRYSSEAGEPLPPEAIRLKKGRYELAIKEKLEAARSALKGGNDDSARKAYEVINFYAAIGRVLPEELDYLKKLMSGDSS